MVDQEGGEDKGSLLPNRFLFCLLYAFWKEGAVLSPTGMLRTTYLSVLHPRPPHFHQPAPRPSIIILLLIARNGSNASFVSAWVQG